MKKYLFSVVVSLLLSSFAHAVQTPETICGEIERNEYCRQNICTPPTYELNAPFGNFMGRYVMTSSTPEVQQKISDFFTNKTKVCVTGLVQVTPESFPEDFQVTDVLPDSGQVQGTRRTMVSFKVTYDIQGKVEASLALGVPNLVYIRAFNAETGEPLACGVDFDVDRVVVTDLDGNKLVDAQPFCRSNLGGILSVGISMAPLSDTTIISPDHMFPIYLTIPDSSFETMPQGIHVN